MGLAKRASYGAKKKEKMAGETSKSRAGNLIYGHAVCRALTFKCLGAVLLIWLVAKIAYS